MFLGPLEQAKPWNTAGIWSFGFLKKLCRLYFEHNLIVTDEIPKDNLKTLHKTIKKVADDIYFSSIFLSQFMICVNELISRCHSRAVLDRWLWISPYAPHIAEELWSLLGNKGLLQRFLSLFSNQNI
jgi:leucyl-tRNA synthetase